MPAVRSAKWFITCTHPDGMGRERIDKVLKWCIERSSRYILVKEHHRSGKVHLHGAIHFDSEKRSDHLKNDILVSYAHPEELEALKKRAVVVAVLYDEVRLIGGYLNKEEGREIVARTDYYSDELLAKMSEDSKIESVPVKDVPSLSRHNVTQVISKFAEESGIPLDTKDDFVKVIIRMTAEGFNFTPVKSELRWSYAYIKSCKTGETSWLYDEIFGLRY